MKYYIDSEEKIYAFESDGSRDHLIKPDMQSITEAEKEALLAPPPETQEETVARLTAAIQSHLDAVAQTRNYDGIVSLCSYATSQDATFRAEGEAGVIWRDLVWRYAYTELDKTLQGLRSVPSESELIAELPQINW